MTAFRPPRLHAITDDRVVGDDRFLSRARSVLAAGGEQLALHLRGPRTAGRRLYELALALRKEADRTGGWLIVNDRVDIARMVAADGLQLGTRGMEAQDARPLLGKGMRIGASVHSREEAARASEAGADFLVVGPLFETGSHPGRPGCLAVLEACAAAGLPMIGIGGITPLRVGQVRRRGAVGVAVLSGIWDAGDPPDAVAEYLESWIGDV